MSDATSGAVKDGVVGASEERYGRVEPSSGTSGRRSGALDRRAVEVTVVALVHRSFAFAAGALLTSLTVTVSVSHNWPSVTLSGMV